MMRKKILTVCIVFLVVGLGIGNVYFMYESRKPHYKMMIGNYVNVDLIYSGNVVNNKEDAQVVELALMRSTSIDKPEVSNRLPDASISISDWNVGMAYMIIDVWFDEDKVIFVLGGNDSQFGTQYKEVVGTFATDVKHIVSKYQSTK
ncbi:hypothetical protein V6615_14280 [Oscillospiraceae bacterium PP1C4]